MRKISFIITTPQGDAVNLTAKRCVKAIKALEAACQIFKLDPDACRLKFNGHINGHADMSRLPLSAITVDDQDELSLEWEEHRNNHRLWITASERQTVRVIIELAPCLIFSSILPMAPVDLARTADESRQRVKLDLLVQGSQLVDTYSQRILSSIAWETT